MKKGYSFIISFLALCFVACQPAATEAELTTMCENLTVVRGEKGAPTEAELIARVEADFVTKEKNLLAWKAKDMRGWDDELKDRLAALADGAEAQADGAAVTKQSLAAEYAKKKEIGAQQFDADLAALKEMKVKALADVTDAVANAKEMFDARIKECIDEAKVDSVSQPLAQCRIQATDKDTYWNKCK